MKYGLNDKPGFFQLLLYGLQWFVVALPSIIIMGLVIAKLHGFDAADQMLYLRKLFVIVGSFSILQVLFGHRLPLIIGPASVLLIGIISSHTTDFTTVYTSIFLGGLLLAVVSFSGLLSRLHRFFTPRVISVILLLISFTLTPVILNMVFSTGKEPFFHLLFALILVLLMILGNVFAKGIWKSTVLLFAIVLGSLVYYLFMGAPASDPTADVASAQSPLFYWPLSFDPGIILAFFFCYIALVINELGSIQAVGYLLDAGHMDKRINRGSGYTGLSNMLSGLLGVVGTVDFSLSPGVIAATGCASRYALIPMGVLMIFIAFMPFLVQGLLYIPAAAMGAIFFYLMAAQLGAGLQMLVKEKTVTGYNSSLIIALPLMVSLLIVFAPATVIDSIPLFIRPILGNGFVMGVIMVFFLEHVLFREKKERMS